MDLKQLDYFLCLAREGNVTRAARRLSIVQPALSMQIAKLEKSLNKQLFNRSVHGVTLTPAGERLVALADDISQSVERAQNEMDRLDGTISGRVSIGMITSAAQSTLALSSAKIAALYPEIQLQVCEGYTDVLQEWVAAGQIDVAIVNRPAGKLQLTAHHILDEEMMLAHAANGDLALPKFVPYGRLGQLDLIIPSRRHGLRRILDDAAADAEFQLRPRLEVDTLPAICDIVASTRMVTVLPGIALHSDLQAGRLVAHRIRKPALQRTVSMLTHPKRAVSGAMTAVINILANDLRAAARFAAQHVR